MPDSPRRLRAPSPRRFAAGALASFVAVFGVLALRVHDGEDPALQPAASVSKTTTTASDSAAAASDDSSAAASDSTSSDSASGDSSGAVSSTPSASTSAS